MPEIRTRGLVLRAFDQGESDRLLHLYTEALGRVSAIAKGARRSRRRFPGTLEILTLVDARLVEPPRASLARLEGARVLAPFEGLVDDLGRYAIACQLAELLDRVTGEREANPALFRFAIGALDVLRGETPDRLLALLLLAKTVARLGYRPQLAACASCGRALEPHARGVAFDPRHGGAVCARCREDDLGVVPMRLLMALETGIRTPLRERHKLDLRVDEVARAEQLLERFFRFHIGLELRTSSFLREVIPLQLDEAGSPGDTPPTDPGGARKGRWARARSAADERRPTRGPGPVARDTVK